MMIICVIICSCWTYDVILYSETVLVTDEVLVMSWLWFGRSEEVLLDWNWSLVVLRFVETTIRFTLAYLPNDEELANNIHEMEVIVDRW